MIKAAIKRRLRLIIQKLMSYPQLRRWGQRLLSPFPGVKSWVIRLVQAGQYSRFAAPNCIEGYGERQQRLMNGLEQRRKPHSHE